MNGMRIKDISRKVTITSVLAAAAMLVTATDASAAVGLTCTTETSGAGRSLFDNIVIDGSSSYLICNAAQLNQVRENLSSQYFLGVDIDLKDWNQGQGFSPIGLAGQSFRGVFDGRGHTISNLLINDGANAPVFTVFRSNVRPTGLFRMIEGAQIQGLKLLSPRVSTTEHSTDSTALGAVAGYAKFGSIIDVSVMAGDIRSTAAATGGANPLAINVGAIAGESVGTLIQGSTVLESAVTSVGGSAGGIVGSFSGYNYTYQNFNKNFSSGTVDARCNAGGLAGRSAYADISAVHTNASIIARGPTFEMIPSRPGWIPQCGRAGGLIGTANDTRVRQAYSDGNVTALKRNGGLIGNAGGVQIQDALSSANLLLLELGYSYGAVGIIDFFPAVTVQNFRWVPRPDDRAAKHCHATMIGLNTAGQLNAVREGNEGCVLVPGIEAFVDYGAAPLNTFDYVNVWTARAGQLPRLTGLNYELPVPDLAVSNLVVNAPAIATESGFSMKYGVPFSLSVDLSNIGQLSATRFSMSWRIGTISAGTAVYEIAPGATQHLTFTSPIFNTSYLAVGTNQISVTADAQRRVAKETNRTNNSVTSALVVLPPEAPKPAPTAVPTK